MSTILSDPEKLFIIHGIQDNFRMDGRSNKEYRSFEIETDVFPHCNGSAKVKLANTKVLAGVKAELAVPEPSYPDRGWIEVTIDSIPFTSSDFDSRGRDEVAAEVGQILTQVCNLNKLLDLRKLCVIPAQQVWVLYVDIMVFHYGGNLMDAAAIATKAALFDTKIQSVNVKSDDGNEPEIEISDDPYDVFSLDVTNLPILFTLHRLGGEFVVDATEEEAACSTCKVVVAVSNNETVLCRKIGSGSCHIDTLHEALNIALNMGVVHQQQLTEALVREKELPKKKNGLF